MSFKIPNELAEAAILLRETCKRRRDCSSCPFDISAPDSTFSNCYFGISPEDWKEITKEVTYNYEVK